MTDVWREAKVPLTAALVTSVGPYGDVNASPKNWWTPVSYQPTLVAVAIRSDSDSAKNVTCTGRFCMHLPGMEFMEKTLHTAKPLPYGENELDDVQLDWTLTPDEKYAVIAGMPHMYCRTMTMQALGDHVLFVAGVVTSVGMQDVHDVLVHRSRNVFMALGPEIQANPYVYERPTE